MSTEEMALERFRQIIEDARQKGDTGLLIWKNLEARKEWGENEQEMFVKDAFEIHGYDQDGIAYGEYRFVMELTRAIRNAFECGSQFTLATLDGKSIAAMAFNFDKMLSNEGHLMFACRSMLYKHLNGPIISFPSCQVIE